MARSRTSPDRVAGLKEVPGEVMTPELQRLQSQSVLEPEPPVAMLVREIEPGSDRPGARLAYQDKPPVPPVAKPSPVPRFVHQNERAPEGLRRYKIRATDMGEGQPVRYVLAHNEDEAREHYLRGTGLAAVAAKIQTLTGEPFTPDLSVRPLAD